MSKEEIEIIGYSHFYYGTDIEEAKREANMIREMLTQNQSGNIEICHWRIIEEK